MKTKIEKNKEHEVKKKIKKITKKLTGRKPEKRELPRRHELCDCGSGLKMKDCCLAKDKASWFDTEEGKSAVDSYNEKVCKVAEDKYKQLVRFSKNIQYPYGTTMQVLCGCGLYHTISIKKNDYSTRCITNGFSVSNTEWDMFLKEFMEQAVKCREETNVK